MSIHPYFIRVFRSVWKRIQKKERGLKEVFEWSFCTRFRFETAVSNGYHHRYDNGGGDVTPMLSPRLLFLCYFSFFHCSKIIHKTKRYRKTEIVMQNNLRIYIYSMYLMLLYAVFFLIIMERCILRIIF